MARGSNQTRGQGKSKPAKGGWTPEGVIMLLFTIALVAICLALVYRTVFQGGQLSSEANNQYTKTSVDVAKRGTIYDRNGEVLASSIESTTINVNPNDIAYSAAVSDEQKSSLEDPAKAVAQKLYEHLGEEYDLSYNDLYERVTRQGTAYVIIQRRCDKDIADALKEDLNNANLQGVYYEEDSTRVYPNGDTGSQVIGTVGLKMVDESGNIVKDEEVQGRDDLTESYRGTSGLELEYDSMLSGTNGYVSQEKSDSGIPIAGGAIVMNKADDGEDMMTSLDIKLQQKAESSLKKAVKKYSAKGGSVTVMDASTGEIYASASFTKDSSSKSGYSYDAGKLWSVADSYEPGSTFKSFTAAAVLANSKVTTSTNFAVPETLKVYDATIKDSHDRSGTETMSLNTIIAESSNIGTVIASHKVTQKNLYKTYKKFGFGKDSGVDFPGAAWGLLEKTEDWDGVQAANITFGQGVSVTGVQLVRAYGALEQGGTMHVPHFLVDLPNNQELSNETTAKLTKTKKVASKKTCKDVTKMLRSVVTSGTGTAAAIKGLEVVGKTGTAEIPSNDGTYLSDTYLVSFCGWLDNTNSDLVCLVTIEQPETEEGGGPVCGPIFADIMSFAADRYQISAN